MATTINQDEIRTLIKSKLTSMCDRVSTTSSTILKSELKAHACRIMDLADMLGRGEIAIDAAPSLASLVCTQEDVHELFTMKGV